MTPIYYIAVFFVFHCFFLSKCGKILFAAKHGGGFFVFFGILPLQKKSGSRRRADFFARCGKGRKAASLLRRSPVFLRGALRITVRRAAFAAADFFAWGGKGAQSGKPFAAQPGFFRGTGSPSRFCGGEFFRTVRKRGAPQSAERALALFQRE